MTKTYSLQIQSQSLSLLITCVENGALKHSLSVQTLCSADAQGGQGEGEAETGTATHGREDRTLRDAV